MNEEFNEEDQLSQIAPTQEDFVDRRISHIQFAKVIYWLYVKSQKNEFVYASELSEFMKYSQTRAYAVLRDLCKAEIMLRKHVGNLVEFHFGKNSTHPIINKYIEKAKKTLGLY